MGERKQNALWKVHMAGEKRIREREREEGITADFGGNPNDSARKFRRS